MNKRNHLVFSVLVVILATSTLGDVSKSAFRNAFDHLVTTEAKLQQHEDIYLEFDQGKSNFDDFYQEEQGLSLVMGPSKLVAPYADQTPDYRRVCVYPNWSILRESNMAKIYPEDIDPNLCTHIHYAYANIDVRTLQLSPSQYQDFNSGDHGAPLYERIMKLRQVNPNLKILISIGGWFAKSTPFNRILTNEVTRNTFIQNTLNFLRNWKFDGLDIQWEYPGDVEYGATSDSKQRFTSLVRNLRKAFKEEYRSTFKKYILTAFVPSDEARIDAGYQVKLVCRYLDYISVATYDYTGPYDTKTGYNSPLFSRTHIQNSVNSSIYYWLERGCPSRKLLVGIPTYARAFKIIKRSNSPNLVFVGIESEPFVTPSVYTSEEGILSYYEVCEMMSNKETRVYWDDLAEVPFAIVMQQQASDDAENEDSKASSASSSNLWISYEDARSARKKVEYAKQMQLGGVSIWSLDMDDFKGAFCNLGPFPIIEAVKEEFEHKILQQLNSSIKYLIKIKQKVTLIGDVRPNAEDGIEFEPEIEAENDNDSGLSEIAVSEKKTTKLKSKPQPVTAAPTTTAKPKTTSTKRVQQQQQQTPPITTIKTNKTSKKQKPISTTSVVAQNNNHKPTTALMLMTSTSTRNRELDEQNEFDAFKNRLKKFKAVREIKLVACLDKKICNINSSNSFKSSFYTLFIYFICAIFVFLL